VLSALSKKQGITEAGHSITTDTLPGRLVHQITNASTFEWPNSAY
jgi:hypothetical protein